MSIAGRSLFPESKERAANPAPEEQEVETLKWMIECIQEATDLPIAVDSPSVDVLAEAYTSCFLLQD